MRAYKRSERVSELMLREVSDIIQRRLKDPRIGFCTVTRVILSEDLRHAKIFVSVMGSDEEEQTTLEALDQARGFIRREIGKRIRLRYTPEILFRADHSLEHLDRIGRLLKQISEEETNEEP